MSNRVNAIIAVVPHGYTAEDVAKLSPNLVEIYKKQFSNVNEIKVNNYNGGGYIVVYTDEEFKKLNPKIFIDNFVKLFLKNVPNTIIDVTLQYMYAEQVFMEEDEEIFDAPTAKAIMITDTLINAIKNKFISYHRLISFNAMVEDYQNWVYDNDVDGSDDEINEEEYEEDQEQYSSYANILGIPMNDEDNQYDSYYDEYEDDEESPMTEMERILGNSSSGGGSGKKKRKSKSYGRSKVLKNADNAKKAINRHGVIIADNKRDIKADAKMIKEFLKDFIPGNQSWKKEFRDELLRRWLNMYCVSRKELKKLEKRHRNMNRRKQSNVNTNKTLEFTKRLLNMPLDNWDNPNK